MEDLLLGTGAYMTVRNQTDAAISSTVANTKCMYQNGDDGSHLERFNAQIGPNGGAISGVYVEADGNFFHGCSAAQSQFTLSFADIGSITLDLGSGAFNTSVVNNTAPGQIHAQIGQRGDQYTIDIRVAPPSVLIPLANSWIWANVPAIEQALKLPPATVGPLSFGAAALSGLETLRCIDASFDGRTLQAALVADQLLTHCSVSFEGVTVDGGLTLQTPQLSATSTIQPTASAVSIGVTSFQLVSGTVDLEAAGLNIPNFVLSGLMAGVEEVVNNPPIQGVILDAINGKINPSKS